MVALLLAGLANFGWYFVVGQADTVPLESSEEWGTAFFLPELVRLTRTFSLAATHFLIQI